MGAPTIVTHGSDAQKQRYLRPLFTNEEIWCQLFSEPGAGSDVAGLSSRAVRDGDEWVVNGQKVWTSGGQIADRGMLLARLGFADDALQELRDYLTRAPGADDAERVRLLIRELGGSE